MLYDLSVTSIFLRLANLQSLSIETSWLIVFMNGGDKWKGQTPFSVSMTVY